MNLPDMIAAKCNHSAVSMGNKLLVNETISFTSSEVIDNNSKKFTRFNKKNTKETY